MAKFTARLVFLVLVCSALLFAFASAGENRPFVGTDEEELEYNEKVARYEIPEGFKFANVSLSRPRLLFLFLSLAPSPLPTRPRSFRPICPCGFARMLNGAAFLISPFASFLLPVLVVLLLLIRLRSQRRRW